MDVWLSVVAVVGAAVLVASVVVQVRWRRRTRAERDAVRYDMARVHKMVRQGSPVGEDDRLAAVLDVEQHVLILPNGVAGLLLAGAIAFNTGTTPAGTTFRYAVGGLMAVSAFASTAIVAGYIVTARRLGIRPRSLWQ
ncbi:hypothetical protein [Lapillicoccus jejuensis]|uniref:Uncharacterized protein n=1 Tax=Lapillicoccus jejuensis TaxID=402171 RepID=A0A542E1M4_9MICO|nr:hypothetical protein [Lapillicoccus jejuensis]TQJ09237.1 hypothetical protein FB458_2347 [Lapillicoccus jejuensis]